MEANAPLSSSPPACCCCCYWCDGRWRREGRISPAEWTHHAILEWRLRPQYLLYCGGCFAVTAFLLIWNILEWMSNDGDLSRWRHHAWEDMLEVGIGLALITETSLNFFLLGIRGFVRSKWCIFDLVVALLTLVSIAYGVVNTVSTNPGQQPIVQAEMPLLMVRFVLQPLRVLAVCGGIYRARHLQHEVDDLSVSFDSLNSTCSSIHGAATCVAPPEQGRQGRLS
mmetsp:Transcript_65825/g.140837  ORF Transcript_65825/g.140837 Transcript_65825/m.140837 type:complete len:225 (-) Transcript_65825:271-945(-)